LITYRGPRRLLYRWTVAGVVTLMVAGVLSALASPAQADTAPVPPVTVPTVSADALPTVQINGVVWDQVVVGNMVYVTGEFTSARPAGSPAGSNETARTNLLAYNITTGVLNTTWKPTLNGKGAVIAASTDGTRIFVGGSFTSVSGVTRNRVVALDATTGAVITTWNPGTDARVRSLAVSGSTLYMGGIFTSVAGQARTRLAAVSTTTGALLAWTPAPDAEVLALTAPAGSGKVVAGGKFANVSGAAAYGMAALDATTGALLPWPVGSTVRNAGANAAIYSLNTDGNQVYGTGYTYGSGGNFEGTFAAKASDGTLVFVTGCRGDTYDAAPIGGVLYYVSHTHTCSAVPGGLPQQDPWTFARAQAETIGAAANGQVNNGGNFSGKPAPELLHWLPTLEVGDVTGESQAAWSAVGNSNYVSLGGEFPTVNGISQAGLVRFAVSSIAPNEEGPQGGTQLLPSFTAVAPGAVRVTWTAAWDRDNRNLTYEVLRGASLGSAVVVGTLTKDSNWWNRPTMTFVDGTAPGGSSQTYRIRVKDAFGNTVNGDPVATTIPAGGGTNSPYAAAVRSDGATSYWRLSEASGTIGYNWNGSDDLTVASNVTRSAPGALANDANTATTFPGSGTVPAASTVSQAGPQTFTAEAWFKTTSTTGGKILGFGNSRNAASTAYDRHIYLTNNGRLVFGVNSGGVKTITTTTSYNDGQWHHVAGTLGSGGLKLYVDGTLAGTNVVTSAQVFNGYWRVDGDALNSSWPSAPTSTALAGTIDDVAIYPTALSAGAIQQHSQLGGGTAVNQSPTASFSSSVSNLAVSFNGSASSDPDGSISSYAWNFGDGATGTGATSSHTYAAAGTYTVQLTVTDNQSATGSVSHSVTVTPAVNQSPTASFSSSVSNLAASFDGSASSDPDGSISSYAWNFGDGATGTGVTPSHTYAASGTYTVQLTVTDNGSATATVSHPVTVATAGAGDTIAADTFTRTVASGWGSADTGGAWTTSGSGITLSVTSSSAQASIPAGRTLTAFLNSATNLDTDLTHQVWLDEAPTGGGVQATSVVRSTAGGSYRVTVKLSASGQVAGSIVSVVGTTSTTIAAATVVAGITYTPGLKLLVRTQATGSSPTTIRYRVWAQGSTEPSTWLQTVTDSSAGLQEAGAIGFVGYVSGTATQASTMHFDDLTAISL
jgi:PKD repeat protein